MKLFLLNSDFGVRNTIGARAKHIYDVSDKNITIYCRDHSKEFNRNVIKVMPFGRIIMQILTGLPIYISSRLKTDNLKINIFSIFLLKKLKKIDLNQVEIVHSWDYLPKVYKYLKSKNKNIRIIQDVPIANGIILNSNKNLKINKNIKDSLKYINKFIVPSEFVKRSLELLNVNTKKIFVVPFGVDTQVFKPIPKNKKFGVAFSGNVNNRKGIKYLIESWNELNLKNSELNIYGRVYPEVKKELKKVKGDVKIHGFINLKEELGKNEIYAFPTLLEGSAKSVYEAMACGLAVITTPNAGSIITNNKDGFIIPIQNSNLLSKKIKELYGKRTRLRRIQKNAIKTAKKYSWKRYGKQINLIYEQVIKNEK